MRRTRNWVLENPLASAERTELIRALREKTKLSDTTLALCLKRGVDTPSKIETFFSPKLENLTSPFKIRDMEKAVERVLGAQALDQSISVFSDYDVDGTSGGALLTWFFRDLGWSFEVRQPDRFKDGYGLNVQAVEDAASRGSKVLITVDCGITSFAPIARAKELGLDVIVIDHHQIDVSRGLPDAFAVIDPQRQDCESGLKQLCGCALAFYFAMAVRSKLKERGQANLPNLKQHLDLVALATAADQVPLVGDNRILIKQGLEVLKNTSKPGFRALLDIAGIGSREIQPNHLSFTIGPKINASGRVRTAQLALELLTERNPVRGLELAQEIEKLNLERQVLQNEIWDEVRGIVEARILEGRYAHGIVVASNRWHEGVIGIVASRVTETFHRPAVVISLNDGHGKGSVRSFGGKDVLQALRQSASCLKTFGGHAFAAGLGLNESDLGAFEVAFDEACKDLPIAKELHSLMIDVQMPVEGFSLKILNEIESLAPFGPGNPEPLFLVQANPVGLTVLKERHLRFSLQSQTQAAKPVSPKTLSAIWFGAGENVGLFEELKSGSGGYFVGIPEINRFRGEMKPSFRIKDYKVDFHPPQPSN